MERVDTSAPSSLPSGSRALDAFVLGAVQESTSSSEVHLGWAETADATRVRVTIYRGPLGGRSVTEAVERSRDVFRSLIHPNLATLITCGVERGALVVVEPEIVGSTLRDRLVAAPGQRLSIAEATRIVQDSARALAWLAARPEPVVHGALTPESIYLEFPDRRVRIVGAGLAQMLRAAGLTGAIGNSSGYAAPESFDAPSATSPSVDQFALAAIAFECITGSRAFATSAEDTRPRVPAALDPRADAITRVLHRAWSARAEERYPDIAAFADAFTAAARPDDASFEGSSATPGHRDSCSRSARHPPAPRDDNRRASRPSLRRALARAQASLGDYAVRSDSPSRTSGPVEADCIEIAPWDVESVPAMPARSAPIDGTTAKSDRIALRSREKHRAQRRLRARRDRRAPTPQGARPLHVPTADADFVVPSLPPTSVPELRCELTTLPPTSIPRLECQLVSLAPTSVPEVPCEIASLAPAASSASRHGAHVTKGDTRPVIAPEIPSLALASIPPTLRAPSRRRVATSAAALALVGMIAIAVRTQGTRPTGSGSQPTHAAFAASSDARDQRSGPHPLPEGRSPEPGRPSAARSVHDTLQHAVDECGSRYGRVGRHVHATIRYAARDGIPAEIHVWGPPLRGDFRDCVIAAARSTRAPANVTGPWEHDYRLRSF